MKDQLSKFGSRGTTVACVEVRLAADERRQQRRPRIGQLVRLGGAQKVDRPWGVPRPDFKLGANHGKPVVLGERAQGTPVAQLCGQLARLRDVADTGERGRGQRARLPAVLKIERRS